MTIQLTTVAPLLWEVARVGKYELWGTDGVRVYVLLASVWTQLESVPGLAGRVLREVEASRVLQAVPWPEAASP